MAGIELEHHDWPPCCIVALLAFACWQLLLKSAIDFHQAE